MDGIDFRSGGARLLSLASAVPPHRMSQSDAAQMACKVFSGRFGNYERMAPVFETAGIRTRYTVVPAEWYLSGKLGWPECMKAYLQGAEALFIAAATRALEAADLRADQIDAIVTISSTGIATPSLEARVATRMGFRSDIERVPVFGLGCAGGVSGIAIVSRLARARPGFTVLVVTIELCTLAFRLDELTKANLVATALFGDGASTCVVRAGEGGIAEVEMSGEHM